jgi:hypothetical protein
MLQTSRDTTTPPNAFIPIGKTAAGEDRIQRLSVEDPHIDFSRTTSITTPPSGGSTVILFHEGVPNNPLTTVVVKANDEKTEGMVTANALVSKLSGGLVPKTIVGNQYRQDIIDVLNRPEMDQYWQQAQIAKAEFNKIIKAIRTLLYAS